jgi:hypothetical protein
MLDPPEQILIGVVILTLNDHSNLGLTASPSDFAGQKFLLVDIGATTLGV